MRYDRLAKSKQKKYKDAKPYVKHHQIKIGNKVLLKQKQSKSHPPYSPEPYEVVGVNGHQITAVREDRTITRDAQKWKKVEIRNKPDYSIENQQSSLVTNEVGQEDETTAWNQAEAQMPESPEINEDPESTSDTTSQAIVDQNLETGNNHLRGNERISQRSNKGKPPTRLGIDD